MAKSKILFLINNLKVGGAENVFTGQFLYFKKRGLEVKMAVLSDDQFYQNNRDRILIGQNDLFFINWQGLADLSAYFRLLGYIRTNKINYVYATLDKANLVAPLLKLFLPALKIIKRESGMADRKSRKIKLSDRIFNFLCHKVIAVSEEVKASLVEYQPEHRNKIVVLENGVAVELGEEEVKAVINQKDHKILKILNVGSMNNDNKGQIGLVELVKRLKQKGIDCLLYLAGGGKLKSEIEKKATIEGIEDKVKFTGVINQKELKYHYLGSNLFILNSSNEGCPNVVLEAMSYGLLVAASQVGGVKNMIEDGVSGFIFKHNDLNRLEE